MPVPNGSSGSYDVCPASCLMMIAQVNATLWNRMYYLQSELQALYAKVGVHCSVAVGGRAGGQSAAVA